MFSRAAERAGVAGLQLLTVGFQALDAAFLLQQFLLVGDLCVQFLVLDAQGGQRLVLRFDQDLPLLQLCALRRLQRRQFAPLPGEVFALLPAVQAGLFALPVLAQFGQRLPGEALVLFGQRRLQGAVGLRFCEIFGVDRSRLFDQGQGAFLLLLFQLLRHFLLAGDLLLQLVALFELLAPDAEPFAQLRPLRLGGAEVVKLPALALNLLQLALRLLGDAGREAAGDVVLLAVLFLQAGLLDVQRLQFAIALPSGGIGLLPVQMQRLQGFGRFAGGQSAQFGGGGCECDVGFVQFAFGSPGFLFALGKIEPPLALGLGVLMLALNFGQLRIKPANLQLHRLPLFGGQQLHAVGSCLELVELSLGIARLFENPA